MDDTQGTDTKVEGAEGATQQKEEPTVYKTEEDYQKALQTAVSRGLESTTKQLSLRDAEVRATKAEAESVKANYESLSTDLQELQKQHDDLVSKQFADDPEARQAYIDRRAIAEEKRKLTKDKADAEHKLYDAEKLAWSGAMALKSIELKAKYQVPQNVLDTCITEEQMETVAKAFPEVKATEETKESKFDNATSTARVSPSDLSPDDLLKEGFKRLSKK